MPPGLNRVSGTASEVIGSQFGLNKFTLNYFGSAAKKTYFGLAAKKNISANILKNLQHTGHLTFPLRNSLYMSGMCRLTEAEDICYKLVQFLFPASSLGLRT